jgi:hypothetical protein
MRRKKKKEERAQTWRLAKPEPKKRGGVEGQTWKRQLSSCFISFYFIFLLKTSGSRGDSEYWIYLTTLHHDYD